LLHEIPLASAQDACVARPVRSVNHPAALPPSGLSTAVAACPRPGAYSVAAASPPSVASVQAAGSAEPMLVKYRGRWGGKIAPLYEEHAY